MSVLDVIFVALEFDYRASTSLCHPKPRDNNTAGCAVPMRIADAETQVLACGCRWPPPFPTKANLVSSDGSQSPGADKYSTADAI